MKTYDVYGATPELDPTRRSGGAANTTAVAVRVQHALHIDMLARAEKPEPLRHYAHTEYQEDHLREQFVLANVTPINEQPVYPEYDYPVIVGINDPADPAQTRASLEALGLTLLRRRRREFCPPRPTPAKPLLELYGATTNAASAVALLSPLLGMTFDGNEHAVAGGDSHYYDESERFGTILIFDNVPQPFDDLPFPKYAGFSAVLVALNPADCAELRRLILEQGFTVLSTTGPERQP